MQLQADVLLNIGGSADEANLRPSYFRTLKLDGDLVVSCRYIQKSITSFASDSLSINQHATPRVEEQIESQLFRAGGRPFITHINVAEHGKACARARRDGSSLSEHAVANSGN